jgi:hypothetical protein
MTTKPKKGRASLVVDISMAQVAFISCETASTIRRLCPHSDTMRKLADAIDGLVGAKADTLEGLMCASAVVGAWLSVVKAEPELHILSTASARLRGAPRQDAAIARLTQLTKLLTRPISSAAA